MAHKPVGINSVLSTSGTSAKTGAISQQTDTLRIAAVSAGIHVAIGTEPTATSSNYYIAAGTQESIAIGQPSSQRVVGFSTGLSTLIDFPEGTGSPFAVGDAVTLSAPGQSAFDFTHQVVTDVNNTSDINGYFSTRITVDYDSSSVSGTFNPNRGAELRRSIKVAAITDTGTGTANIQQVQISGAG